MVHETAIGRDENSSFASTRKPRGSSQPAASYNADVIALAFHPGPGW